MNVLIIGLGSIGQRHLKNLQSIRLVKKIYIYRKKFQTPTLINYSTPSKKKIDEIYDVTYIKNLKNFYIISTLPLFVHQLHYIHHKLLN